MQYTSKFSGEEIDSILDSVASKQDAIPDLETIRSNAQNASDTIARMVESGYLFAGIATIGTNPGIPEAKVFYIANGKGTYTNFGSIEVTEDDVVVLYWDTAWHKVATGIASQAKLSELEEEIYTKNEEIIPSSSISGGYVRNNNTISPHDTRGVDVYDVSGIKKVFVEAYCNNPTYFAPFAFSETLQGVGGSVFGAITIDTQYYSGLVDVPANANYIYITHQDGINKLYSVISKSDKSLAEINEINQVALPSKVDNAEYKKTKTDVLELTADVHAISGGSYVIDPTWNEGAYDSSGNKTISSGKCTDKIDIQGCSKIVLHGTFASGSGRCIVLYKDGDVYQTIQESTLFDGIELNTDGLSQVAFSFYTNADKEISLYKIGKLSVIKDDLYGYIEKLDIQFMSGKAYGNNDRMNHPSISSGKYTLAVDVSGYKTITIMGTLTPGSGRRTIMYNQGGDVIIQPTEEDIYNGNNIFDIKGIKFICFSFASGSQPIIIGDKTGGIKEVVAHIPNNKNKIVCWGDSLTNAGIYEKEIQDYVGDKYQVINCGIQGETPYDICARCGAMPMFLKNDVILPNDLSEVAIGNLEDSGMQVINEQGELTGTRTLKMYAAVADDAVNPILIDGIECLLNWNGSSYTLSRKDIGDQVTLKAGEQMFPSATKYFNNPHCVVVWMGTNIGAGDRRTWDYTSKEGIKNTLLKQVKNVIRATGADNYIVVGLHEMNTTSSEYLESVFSAEFGSAFFNLRKYCITNALRDGGITPTADDIEKINEGRCPSSLLKDGIHFTNLGYSLVGQQILKRMKILGIVE